MKWIAKKHTDLHAYCVDDEEGNMICTVDAEDMQAAEAESITKLIAAAPELLLVTRQLLKGMGSPSYNHICKKAAKILRRLDDLV